MNDVEDFLFGAFIGFISGAVVFGLIMALVATSSNDRIWCDKIEKSNMPITFVECLEPGSEVQK